MRDAPLLQDLELYADQSVANKLRARNVDSYKGLGKFLADENGDVELRQEICMELSLAAQMLDKRRVVSPLLAALKSKDEQIQNIAARTLGSIRSIRAVSHLIEILADRTRTTELRLNIIDALRSIWDERANPILKQIIQDTHENIVVRSHALEWYFGIPDPIQDYIQLLSDPEPDMRFWAAYRLAQTFDDISTALVELDRVTASDHTLPIGFGWHIDREAMYALETIYYRISTKAIPDENGTYYNRKTMHLISPAPEYDTLLWRFRHGTENATYINDPLPNIKLSIVPGWLAEALKTKWPDIRLNVRQPSPQAYLLDWHLQIGKDHLIGALHRDQYAVTLTGKNTLMMAFAAWYRTLFPIEQHLYLYQWADVHLELKPGMTATDIEKASDRPSISAMDIIAEDLTFG